MNIYIYETPYIHIFTLSRAHNRKRREEELVTLVVAVMTAESPACTINRASCYMPAHMASLSRCEILIGSSFSI